MRKFSKFSLTALALVLVAMVAAACGGGGGEGDNSNGGGSPTAAAQAFFEGLYSGNADAVRANVCAAGQENVDQVVASMSSLSQTGAEIDYSGLTYTVASEEGDTATVNVGGSLSVTMAGQTMEQPIGDSMGQIPLTRENGAWKVCGF